MASVSSKPTVWHFIFTLLLRKYGPRWLEVRDEVPLSEERPRLDFLLLRKPLEGKADDLGRTLRDLWRHLPLVTVAELKSIGRPYRRRDLDQLWSYTHAYFRNASNGIKHRADLCALLFVPTRTPSLDTDAREMGLVWHDLENGYWTLTGGLFQMYMVEFKVVIERRGDDLLRLLDDETKHHTGEARRFWAQLVGSKEAKMTMQELEGYEELERRMLAEIPPARRLAGLSPEQVLSAFAPKERLAGLTREEILLGLPDDDLRRLPDDYLATFPEATREAVRKRLGR